MTSQKDVARVLLLQAGVLDALETANQADRSAFKATLEAGDVVSPDAGYLGKVRLDPPVTAAKVTDRGALMRWIEEKHPTFLIFPEDPGPLAGALARLEDGKARVEDIDTITVAAHRLLGMLVRGQATGPTLSAAVEKTLCDQVKKHGGRLDEETGDVEEVPGITVTTGDPKLVVTTNKANIGSVAAEIITGSGLRAITSTPED